MLFFIIGVSFVHAPTCIRDKTFIYTSARAKAYLSSDGIVGYWVSRVISNNGDLAPGVGVRGEFYWDGLLYAIKFKKGYLRVGVGEYKPEVRSEIIETDTYSYYGPDPDHLNEEGVVWVITSRSACLY